MRRASHPLWLCRLLPLLLLLFAFPADAHAHLTLKGTDELYAGFLHPLYTPAHLLLVLALGLLAGQHPPLNLGIPMFVFMPVVAAALLLTMAGTTLMVHQSVPIALTCCAGVLVALQKPIPPFACRALFGLSALTLGLDSGVEEGSAWVVAKTLFGTWFSLVLFMVWLASATHWPHKPEVRIGVRIAGSWLVAISLLMLAFSLRK